MTFSIARADLVGALAHLARVVERKTTIPILAFVKIEPGETGGGARLTATDLDIELTATLPCVEGHVDAPFAAPALILHDMVKKLPDKAVVAFDTDALADGRVTVRAGRARFVLNVLRAEDFPDAPGPLAPTSYRMRAGDLARLFGRAQFAISNDESRYYLNGVYFHATSDALVAVATDGYRLARLRCALPDGAVNTPAVIVPRKAVAEIVRLAEAADADFEVGLDMSEPKSRFDFGRISLTTKHIDGTFPDYMRVIPADAGAAAEFDRETIARAADRVSTISTERGRAVKLAFGDDKCVMSAINSDVGEASEEIDCPWDAEPMEVGFNSAYLAQILGALAGSKTVLRLTGPGLPARIEDPSDPDALVVLMPMRV